jgi:CRISPR-associated endoribonuclease Cas6
MTERAYKSYKLKFKFSFEQPLNLPKYYNSALQGFFYKNIDPLLASILHEVGFVYNQRRFKLFTFSKIFGKIKEKNESHILFHPPDVHVYFSTPIATHMKSIVMSLVKKEKLLMYEQYVFLSEVEVLEEEIESKEITVVCLSPIVVYRTPEGSRRHVYLSPFEEQFYDMIKSNLMKKYQLVYGKRYMEDIEIAPANTNSIRKKKIVFKGTLITAWEGLFKIIAKRDMLKVGLECGLGVKNSAGFGCIAKIREKEHA